jgi:hypothetical protein
VREFFEKQPAAVDEGAQAPQTQRRTVRLGGGRRRKTSTSASSGSNSKTFEKEQFASLSLKK